VIKYLKYILGIIFIVAIVACSTKKNTAITRGYHNLTSHYNILFNGEESFKKGMQKLESDYKDNYAELLPVFLYTNDDALAGITSEMDRTIKKSTKMISMHSITVKPEMKSDKELSQKQKEFYNRSEYNKYIDDAYLLMAKSHFYRKEYGQANETFNFIVSNFPESSTVFQARIWLARLANIEERYRESEDILLSLEKNLALPKNILGELYATLTDLYLHQKQYEKAIDALNKTLEYTSRKFLRTRYTFILAQLYSLTGNYQLAGEFYNKVIKLNPPYEMTFNARINRALNYQSGTSARRDIEKQLNKMLKDDKNIEFQDQIYYAIGNLYVKDKVLDKAIDNYKLSIKTSTSNTRQKAKSCLTLADIYYARPDYINAQSYYDSAVTIIDKDYPDYQNIYIKSISLNKLVESIRTVAFEDSVQKLALMPREEILAVIDNIIEQEIKKEEAQRLLEQQLAEEKLDKLSDDILQNVNAPAGGWYFYNATAKSLGKKEFLQTWGNRKLEDNWRRKNKSVVSFAEVQDEQETEETQEGKPAAGEVVTDIKKREYYLQYIPFSDSARQASLAKISNALYTMGEVYSEDLKDYPKAIESYEQLIKRFPNYENNLQVYYRLYNLAKNTKDSERFDRYRQTIIRLYPNSNIAKMMTNPDYIKEVEAEEKKIYDNYENMYQLFLNANYNQLIPLCVKAMKENPAHPLFPKFDYMYTVATGIKKDTLSFVNDLQGLITRYPSTDIADNAQMMISYLQRKAPMIIEKQSLQQAKELYIVSGNETHFFAYLVPSSVNMNQLIFNIVNFNLDNFDSLKLEVKRANLDGKRSLCMVQKFKNGGEAMAYFMKITQDKDILRDINPIDIVPVIISQTNLDKMTSSGKVDQYILFFNSNYR
jgi:tetratricopeptide (TPR) repeat protein